MSVIVQHGGLGGGTAGAPRAREVMKVALLKDPEIRARIEQAGFEAPEDAGAREAEARGEPVDALPLDTPAVDVAAPPPEPAQ
ncbi:hypothetical protein D3C86_1881750 [compost metagenome]